MTPDIQKKIADEAKKRYTPINHNPTWNEKIGYYQSVFEAGGEFGASLTRSEYEEKIKALEGELQTFKDAYVERNDAYNLAQAMVVKLDNEIAIRDEARKRAAWSMALEGQEVIPRADLEAKIAELCKEVERRLDLITMLFSRCNDSRSLEEFKNHHNL